MIVPAYSYNTEYATGMSLIRETTSKWGGWTMRTCLAVGALAVAGLLAAGCSSGSTPAASHAVGGTGLNTGPDAKSLYISCLGSHGVPVSDRGVNRNSPQLRRAEQACRSLQPNPGGSEQITAQDQTDYLKAAHCMRAHGVPEFPDPVFADGGVHFTAPAGLDTRSPQVLRAEATCRRLIPQGLPYSN
jgi:hypothetical protein